jgi:hypothetical protein
MQIKVIPSVFEEGPWLKYVLFVVKRIIADDSFLRILLLPVITTIFEITETKLPRANVLHSFGKEIIKKLVIEISIGGCSPGTFAHAHTKRNMSMFCIHADWEIQSEQVYETYLAQEIKKNISQTLSDHISHNMVFTVVKFLHEIFHLLTPAILELEFETRKLVDPTARKYHSTPLFAGSKIGKVPHQQLCGDMGFVMEEILFGQHLRLYIERAETWEMDRSLCYFEQFLLKLTREDESETRIVSKPPSKKAKRDVEGVLSKPVSKQFEGVEFKFLKTNKSCAYFKNLFAAMNELRTEKTTCESLLRAFLVSTELVQYPGNEGFLHGSWRTPNPNDYTPISDDYEYDVHGPITYDYEDEEESVDGEDSALGLGCGCQLYPPEYRT